MKPVPGRPFQRGEDSRRNKGGRPKGLAAAVRALTNDGLEMVEFYLDVMRQTGQFAGARVPLDVRKDAARELMDRGFGKPVQSTELTGAQGAPLDVGIREIVVRLPSAPDA